MSKRQTSQTDHAPSTDGWTDRMVQQLIKPNVGRDNLFQFCLLIYRFDYRHELAVNANDDGPEDTAEFYAILSSSADSPLAAVMVSLTFLDRRYAGSRAIATYATHEDAKGYLFLGGYEPPQESVVPMIYVQLLARWRNLWVIYLTWRDVRAG